jgi:hypothetical protein
MTIGFFVVPVKYFERGEHQMRSKDEHDLYTEARRKSVLAAKTVKLFGVPLQSNPSDGYMPIWWCGIGINGAEHRETTYRIWHVPKAAILDSGRIDGFTFEGRDVYFYNVARDCTPLEESYSPISLTHSARLFLGGRFNSGPMEWLAAKEEDVPVTLDPTAGPTGTKPPTTIEPFRKGRPPLKTPPRRSR